MANKIARRVQKFISKRNERRQKKHDDKAFTIDETLREYEKAFAAANNYTPSTHYENGWAHVKIHGRVFSYRLAQLEILTRTLWAKVHEREIDPEREHE